MRLWPQADPENNWAVKHSETALTHTDLYTEEGGYEPLARTEHPVDQADITA